MRDTFVDGIVSQDFLRNHAVEPIDHRCQPHLVGRLSVPTDDDQYLRTVTASELNGWTRSECALEESDGRAAHAISEETFDDVLLVCGESITSGRGRVPCHEAVSNQDRKRLLDRGYRRPQDRSELGQSESVPLFES